VRRTDSFRQLTSYATGSSVRPSSWTVGSEASACATCARRRIARAGDQFAVFERLRDEIVGPEVEATEDVVRIVPAGDDQDRRLILFSDAAQHLEPIHCWQAEVHDHEIGSVGLPAPQCLRTVGSFDDDETLTP